MVSSRLAACPSTCGLGCPVGVVLCVALCLLDRRHCCHLCCMSWDLTTSQTSQQPCGCLSLHLWRVLWEICISHCLLGLWLACLPACLLACLLGSVHLPLLGDPCVCTALGRPCQHSTVLHRTVLYCTVLLSLAVLRWRLPCADLGTLDCLPGCVDGGFWAVPARLA
jgi:hypothetical protein